MPRLHVHLRLPCIVGYLLSTVASLACADLTRVTDIGVTTSSDFQTPSGAQLRRNSAVADFTSAFSYQILATGLMSDELSDTRGTRAFADQRRISLANEQLYGGDYPWPDLSKTRLEILRAIASLEQFNVSPRSQVGELFGLVGYIELMMAENVCSGVPLASYRNGQVTEEDLFTRSQLLEHALVDFDSAAASAKNADGSVDSSIAYLAMDGRGRVLLDSGDFAAAALAVSKIPLAYNRGYTFGTDVQFNQLASAFLAGEVFVSDHEGQNGLDFGSGNDARVPVVLATNSIGTTLPVDPNDTIPSGTFILASGVEGQLIQAEAALKSGQVSTWRDILNSLRQNVIAPSITSFPSDSTDNASASTRLGVMFRERAYWLFLSGHREGDLRRLIRQYGLQAEAVFPTGAYGGVAGGTYGTDVTFIPFNEQGDAGYQGCTKRSA